MAVPDIYPKSVRDSGGGLIDRYHLPHFRSAGVRGAQSLSYHRESEILAVVRVALPFADAVIGVAFVGVAGD